MKLPIYFSQLGLKEIQCRVSDRVNFLDPNNSSIEKQILYDSMKEEGIGTKPSEREGVIQSLLDRGLLLEEAEIQYEAELLFSTRFNFESYLTNAPNMKITFGTVKR